MVNRKKINNQNIGFLFMEIKPFFERLIDLQLPDFLEMSNYGNENSLRRYDLAQLRQCANAMPNGLEDGEIINKLSRMRLMRYKMVERKLNEEREIRTYITEYGLEVMRANASCIDGSEGYPEKSGF